jgi:hypothetical protein
MLLWFCFCRLGFIMLIKGETMGISPERQAIYASHFEAFEQRYPTHGSRFWRASGLAQQAAVQEDYPSRLLLAAQWGDERSVLRDTAYSVYGLIHDVREHLNQPVVVLREGALADIAGSPNKGTARRSHQPVKLEYGVVAPDEEKQGLLAFGFRGNATDQGLPLNGIKPPFLWFAARIGVSHRARIKVDAEGTCKVTPVPDPEVSFLPAYEGTVPLEFNRQVYHANRQTESHTVLLGREACAVLAQLNLGTKNGTLHNLSELAISA